MFGGFRSYFLDDNWTSDGTSWVQRATTGPTPRYGHAMAYDSVRLRTVLFGGYGVGGTIGDTWEWDGTSWMQRTTTGPAPRYGHAMAYDSARSRVVLFGGESYDGSVHYFGDTWEWDGTSWTQFAVGGANPVARGYHAMAFDSLHDKVVLFGGDSGGGYAGFLNDTWDWDGASWTQRAIVGTAPYVRYGHAMIYDSAVAKIVMFGGVGGVWDRGTWELDGSVWTRRSPAGPAYRMAHAMTYDSARGRAVLFGGWFGVLGGTGGTYFGDTWEYHRRPLPAPSSASLDADMNIDGKLDALDIAPFISALLVHSTDPGQVYIADFDNSGIVDDADLPPFVNALLATNP